MMKKYVSIVLAVVLVFGMTSCLSQKELPEMVSIGEKNYKRAFAATLYPVQDISGEGMGTMVDGVRYYRAFLAKYDCYVAYNKADACPCLYFNEEVYEEAKAYYEDPENFDYYCLFGDLFSQSPKKVSKMDPARFEELSQFALENAYRPLTSLKNDDHVRYVSISDADHWVDGEIRFYKTCKNGDFTSSQDHIFRVVDDKLVFLYAYDWANEDDPKMGIVDLPDDLGAYFLALAQELEQ